jgi:hypothetical protein
VEDVARSFHDQARKRSAAAAEAGLPVLRPHPEALARLRSLASVREKLRTDLARLQTGGGEEAARVPRGEEAAEDPDAAAVRRLQGPSSRALRRRYSSVEVEETP